MHVAHEIVYQKILTSLYLNEFEVKRAARKGQLRKVFSQQLAFFSMQL